MNRNMQNYLTNASLFRTNKKSKLSSAYTTHQNYFQKQQEKYEKNINIPNITTTKKQLSTCQNCQTNNNSEEYIIKPANNLETIKLEFSFKNAEKINGEAEKISNPYIQKAEASSRVAQKNTIIQNQTVLLEQSSQNTKKQSEIKKESSTRQPIEYRQQNIRQHPVQKGQEHQSKVLQEIAYLKNHVKDLTNQNTDLKQYINKLESEYPSKVAIKDLTNQNTDLKQYINKLESEMHSKVANNPTNQKIEVSIEKPNSFGISNIQKEKVADNPTNQKIKDSSPFEKYNSFGTSNKIERPQKPVTIPIQPNEIPLRQNIYTHLKVSHLLQPFSFESTRQDLIKYLMDVSQELSFNIYELQTLDSLIEEEIHSALHIQCQNFTQKLYNLIDQQLTLFQQVSKRYLYTNKLCYMSQVEEIKCNIDLRQQEIRGYQTILAKSNQWKQVVGKIISQDFKSNINFVLQKSNQVKNLAVQNARTYLYEYNKNISKTHFEALVRQINVHFENCLKSIQVKMEQIKHYS